MKKILLTGANSYIGTSFEKYINENYPNEYLIDTVDMIDDGWRNKNFFGYNVVFHVSGIAHQKETKQNAQIYYNVNRDLAVETAVKAKADGVKQFIFLSTMSVYGRNVGVITRDTQPSPQSHYGISKWQAEQQISPLADADFKVCVLRPPMVYGKDCKGNFNTIRRLVEKLPIFPNVSNQRSMIYIDNLCSYVKMCIDEKLDGVGFPQNREYVCTMDMARAIAEKIDKKVYFDYLSGTAVRLMRRFVPLAQKAFGTLIYKDTEVHGFSYIVVENKQSFTQSV